MREMKLIVLCGLLLAAGLAVAAEQPPARLPPTHLATDEEVQTALLKGILANPNVFAADLRVAVKDGAVILTGTVRDQEAKTTAEKIARTVPGVRSVKNNLILRP